MASPWWQNLIVFHKWPFPLQWQICFTRKEQKYWTKAQLPGWLRLITEYLNRINIFNQLFNMNVLQSLHESTAVWDSSGQDEGPTVFNYKSVFFYFELEANLFFFASKEFSNIETFFSNTNRHQKVFFKSTFRCGNWIITVMWATISFCKTTKCICSLKISFVTEQIRHICKLSLFYTWWN